MPRLRLLTLCLTMAAVTTVAGCGGSSSGGSTAGGSASSAAGTTSTGSSGGGGGTTAFCAEIKRQEAYLQGTALSGVLAGGKPAAWKAYFAQVAPLNQRLVDVAPGDIKSTVSTLQQTSTQLQDALAADGYDVSKLGSAKLLTLLKNPARIEASQKLTTYVQSACSIDLTKVGG